ncbi:MAG TPA: hypothetical protein VFK86_06160, partial [Bauldia sp.]|nr:hypothetical protein [Bauldia sp.]
MDERTRAAVEAAARRAGMAPEAWLRNAIADYAAAEGAAPEAESAARDLDDEDAGAIAAALARLGEQVRAMTAEVQSDRDADRAARWRHDLDETARSTVEGIDRPGTAGTTANLEDAIRRLEAQVATLARRGKPEPPSAAYDDIRDRLETLLARGPEPEPAPARPSRGRSADLERMLRDLEAKIAELNRRPPSVPAPALSEEDARIRRIKARLAEIGDRLAAPPPEAAPRAPAPKRPVTPESDPLTAAIADIARRQSALAGRAVSALEAEGTPAAIGALRAEIVVLS